MMPAAPDFEALVQHLKTPDSALGARAQTLCEALETCLGPRPAALETCPPSPPEHGYAPLRMNHRHRAALLDAAMEVFDGVLAAEFDRVTPHLSEVVTVLWPDGRLAQHPGAALREVLESEDRPAAPVVVRDLRIYSLGELRSVLCHGLAPLLCAASPEPGAVVVTAQLDRRRGTKARALIFAAPRDAGWKILSLPLPSPDDVVAASKKTSASEDEAIRVADRVVRHWMQGHGGQLEAMRNHLTHKVWLGTTVLPAEALRTSLPPAGPEQSWLVFRGTQKLSATQPADVLDPAFAKTVEQQAKATWDRPWPRLRPAWTSTEVAIWDPTTREPTQRTSVRCLLLRAEDRDARDEVSVRWRLAGLFDPSAPSTSPKS